MNCLFSFSHLCLSAFLFFPWTHSYSSKSSFYFFFHLRKNLYFWKIYFLSWFRIFWNICLLKYDTLTAVLYWLPLMFIGFLFTFALTSKSVSSCIKFSTLIRLSICLTFYYLLNVLAYGLLPTHSQLFIISPFHSYGETAFSFSVFFWNFSLLFLIFSVLRFS